MNPTLRSPEITSSSMLDAWGRLVAPLSSLPLLSNGDELAFGRQFLGYTTAEAAIWFAGSYDAAVWESLESGASPFSYQSAYGIAALMAWVKYEVEIYEAKIKTLTESTGLLVVRYDTQKDYLDANHVLFHTFKPYQTFCAILQMLHPDKVRLMPFDRDDFCQWAAENKLCDDEGKITANEKILCQWAGNRYMRLTTQIAPTPQWRQ